MARKYLTPIDLTGLELTNFKIQNLSNNPTAYGKGHTYFNTTENELRTYNGTEWVSVGGKIGFGNTASRPTAGHAGAAYADTQTGTFYVDNGTAWVQIGANAGDITTAINALDTDAIEEGTTNLYFTNERAQDAIGLAIDAGTQSGATLSYIDGDGAINISIDDQFPSHDTDDLNEGTTNLYFTDERAQDAIATAIDNGSQSGISVVFDDALNALNFTVSSTPTFTTEIVFEGSTADSNQTRLQVTDPTANDNIITLPDASGTLALTSDITTAIDAIDTDAIEEGLTNLYFTDQRALDATAAAYDPAGSASTAQTNAQNYADGLATNYEPSGSVSTHSGLTTGVHGVTGDVVGTSDIQTLTNKTIDGVLGFGTEGSQIADSDGALTVEANGNLSLEANNGDIVLNADGNAYVGSATAGNEIATHSYVDSAVSGLNWKQAVNLLSTTNVAIESGGSSVDLVGTVIDGHAAFTTADAGYRILLTGQTNGAQNGIYELTLVSTQLHAVRATDADVYTELVAAAVFVMEGTNYGSTSWVQSNHYLTDFTGQSWNQFSGQGTYIGSDSILIDGNQVSVILDSDSLAITASGLKANLNATGGIDNDNGLFVKTADGVTLDPSGNVTIDTAVVVRKYAQDITFVSGTPTSFNIDHNLGTRDCQVTVYSTSTYEEVIVDVTRTSTSRVVLDFAESPASGAYRVVVQA